MPDVYQSLLERIKDIGRLAAVESLLEWDQETYMPESGVEARAETMATVAAVKHERLTSPEIGELLAELGDGQEGDGQAGAR